MPTPTIIIKEKQETRQLEVKRMAIYKQTKIVEAEDEDHQTYFVFFYKEKYLNFVTAKKINKQSHVAMAFKKGVVFHPPHPFIETVLSSHPHFKKQSFNDLFRKLPKQSTLQETALIASYFESFIKKEKIAALIKSLYYQERRDGKLLSCFRILHILKDVAPDHSLLHSYSGDMNFTKYAERYKEGDPAILAKDPIYVEKKMYGYKDNDQAFHKLVKLYSKEDRVVDLIALYINRITQTKKADDYHTLHALIVDEFNEEDTLVILEDLYQRVPAVNPLKQTVLNTYLKLGKLKNALTLINKHKLKLKPEQSQQLTNLVKENKSLAGEISPDGLQKLTLTLLEADDEEAADILHLAITSLMDDHNLAAIQTWSEPLRHLPEAAPVLQKVDEMAEISEDPNHQQRLGELYHYFHQPKLAIECMSWDMELRTEDPKPVHWLAKLYHEVGMEEEHKAYQQLYIDMVKRA
ncbi:hypothetical protein Q7A53_11090 [Halobacillus rhizosphaerae]|uniref:hypothetical protein n=1 Tax=Halobacillus rhizosphaerae TaxID=3064889 RepID=UPI00398AE1D4